MDTFAEGARRLRLHDVLVVSVLNGGFVAVGIAWKDAMAGVVSEWLGTVESTPAKLLNALVTTLFVCACVFALSCLGARGGGAAEAVRTTPIKR